MTRAVIYARYSSHNQRDASIEDQIRQCKAHVEHQGWRLTNTYTDRAISGASPLRPGYQKLLEDARSGLFEVVVSEALGSPLARSGACGELVQDLELRRRSPGHSG